MKRIFSFLIALLLVASTAGASDFSNFNFNFDWSPSGNSVAAFYSPFTTTLSVLTPPRAYPGTTGTFTRASAQYVYDHENVLRKVESGSIAIPGSRIVTNLLTYSEDLSNAAWGLIGTATKSGNTFLLPAVNDRGYQTYSANVSSGETLSFRISLSGTGTTHIRIAGGVDSTSLPITLASTAVTYRVALTLTANVTGVSVYVRRDSGDTATSVTVHNAQLENVTAQTNQNPGEYVKTTSAAVTKCFSTLNGNTVDANGVVTEATGAAISGIDGPLLEVASTNKVTAYGIIPADSYGTTRTSGYSLVLGVKYEIVTRTTLDFTTVGAANNNAGTQFVATGAGPLGASDSVKDVLWGTGTKSFYSGGAFIQNITGLTLSGDTAAVLSIVTDETEILAAGLGAINPGFKVYKLDNSGGSTDALATASGTAGNTNTHTWSTYVKGVGWFGRSLLVKYDFNTSALTWYSVTGTPGATSTISCSAAAGQTVYFLAPQLEEQPAATSYIPTAGATATRAATSLSYPIAGNFGVPASIKFDWTPATSNVAQSRYLLGSYTDANNSFGILHDGTNLIFRKRVGGTNYDATKALTPVAGTTYSIGARINADYTTDVFVNAVKGTGNSNTSPPAATTTFKLGDLNGANGVISSQIKNLKIYNYKKKLPDSLMYLDMKYRTADSYFMEVAA